MNTNTITIEGLTQPQINDIINWLDACLNYAQIASITGASLENIDKVAKAIATRPAPLIFRGYSRRALTEAFNKVKNSTNWKYPIDAVIAAREQDVTDAAISFFAGGQAKFEPAPFHRGGELNVTAPGYYKLIGS